MRRHPQFLNRHTGTITARYGPSRSADLRHEMRQDYQPLIAQVPYVGGRRNRYTPSLEMAAWALAIYRVLSRHGGSVQEAGEVLHEYVKSRIRSVPPPLRARMLRPERARAEKQAKWTQQRRYTADWFNEIVEGDGRTFDWGIDITECGLLKFLHAQGVDELTPYLCDLDYVTAEAAGVALTRTKTLALGCDSCDFRWRIPGQTIAVWPPTFDERRCGLAQTTSEPQEESQAKGAA